MNHTIENARNQNHFQHFLKKSDDEIAEEKALYEFGAAVAHGVPFRVCPYYFKDENGKIFNLSELTEKQILDFCTNSIDTFVRVYNSRSYLHNADNLKHEIFNEASELLSAVEKYCHYEPSWQGMKTIVKYTNSDIGIVNSVAQDLFCASNAKFKLDEVKTITKFIQESKGNFNQPTTEQMYQVIDQAIINENAKNKKVDFERAL